MEMLENLKPSHSPEPAILVEAIPLPEQRMLLLHRESTRASPEANVLQGDVRPALEVCHCLQANQSQLSD